MRLSILLLAIAISTLSCKQEVREENASEPMPSNLIQVADNIIYDVIVAAESDDPWEVEKVAGFDGAEMVDKLFESIYNGELETRDYHTGKDLSVNDIRQIEKQEGFERNNIGKIQFTEDWYFDPVTLEIEKKVELIVFGYRTVSEDIERVGYMAAFEIIIQ